MPTYLCHGFRWPRQLVRIHIILQNIDDAAAEWLMAPATTAALLENFRSLYPQIMGSLDSLAFIEQYDPLDERTESKSQPFAYVCDIVHEVKLGVDIDEVRGKGVSNEGWNATMELRDAIAPGEKVAWFVVVCGDTERWAPPTVSMLENGGLSLGSNDGQRLGSSAGRSNVSDEKPSSSKGGFKKLFGLRSKKSMKDLQRPPSRKSAEQPPFEAAPPMPGTAV